MKKDKIPNLKFNKRNNSSIAYKKRKEALILENLLKDIALI